MLVGGALVNAPAFSGSNYVFTILRSSGVDEEHERHDKAVAQLQAAQATWSRKQTERLDFVVLGVAATGFVAYQLAKK